MVRRTFTFIVVWALLFPAAPTAADPLPTTPAASAKIARPEPTDDLASALIERREEPFRDPQGSVTVASAETVAQEYFDTCRDATQGDIDRVFQIDDRASVLGWAWSTCVDRPFRRTQDELVLFLIDEDVTDPYFREDFVIVQYMDGYYEVYDTLQRPSASEWWLLDSGFGSVGPSPDGRRTLGSFIIDGDATLFPFTYHFSLSAHGDGRVLDLLPNADQQYPSFPTDCSLTVFARAQLLTEPGEHAAVLRALEALGLTVSSASSRLDAISLEAVDDTILARLGRLPGVAEVERPKLREVTAFSNDPEPSAWAIEQLRLAEAWESIPSNPVHIAVIDQGVNGFRADLTGRVGAGFDSVMRPIPAGRDSAMGDHGTAVAGVIGATRNNATEVAGVNPAAVIRPIRFSDHNGCITSESIVSALDAAISMSEVRLINMSFGGPPSVVETAALDRAAAAGKIMAAATGNDGETHPGRANYPAAHPAVIGVGSSTPNRQVAPYSQQAAVELIAPGGAGTQDRFGDVATLGAFDSIEFSSGTSYAAPYVTGALSLWLAVHPNATADEARRALQAAAVDVTGTSADGSGILDVAALLASNDSSSFSDIAGTTHAAAIEAVAAAGITGGFSDGTFRPGGNVTRGQMAAFLARALDLPASSGTTFTDVAGTTHAAAIEAVAAAGITGGFSDGTFRPGGNVTRGQMAAFLARALDL